MKSFPCEMPHGGTNAGIRQTGIITVIHSPRDTLLSGPVVYVPQRAPKNRLGPVPGEA